MENLKHANLKWIWKWPIPINYREQQQQQYGTNII